MEKRTLLAFVLSLAVFIVWSLLFVPEQEQIPPKEDIADKEAQGMLPEASEASGLTRPAPSRGIEKMVGEAIQKVDEKEIEVDTPLYRAVFTNVGPTIKSLELKEYHETIERLDPADLHAFGWVSGVRFDTIGRRVRARHGGL